MYIKYKMKKKKKLRVIDINDVIVLKFYVTTLGYIQMMLYIEEGKHVVSFYLYVYINCVYNKI